MVSYPTEWSLGKARGAVFETGSTIRITIDGVCTIFKVSDYADYEAAKQAALNYRYAESTRLGKTRNQIRYLDGYTIEVQLTHDMTMLTDALFIPQVETYLLSAKRKGSTNQYYAVYQDKKMVAPFTDLICPYKPVKYINGNSLDCRFGNLRSFSYQSSQEDVSVHFLTPYNELPEGVWILGKPAGTIFQRTGDDIWSCVIQHPDQYKTRTFNFPDNGGRDQAYQVAYRWMVNVSHELGMTKNLIKLEGDVVYVQLTKNQVMITDRVFLPLIQQIPLFVTNSMHSTKYYCGCIVDGHQTTFHKLITGYSMTDHLSHPLDNRMKHLRWADHSLNNSNRLSEDHMVGVSRVIDGHGEIAYRARWKLQGTEHSRFFYVNTCGSEENAEQAAQEYRTKIFESKPDDFEPLLDEIPSTGGDLDIISTVQSRIREILTKWQAELITSSDVYLLGAKVSNKDTMFDFYTKTQAEHLRILQTKLAQLDLDYELATAKLAYK